MDIEKTNPVINFTTGQRKDGTIDTRFSVGSSGRTAEQVSSLYSRFRAGEDVSKEFGVTPPAGGNKGISSPSSFAASPASSVASSGDSTRRDISERGYDPNSVSFKDQSQFQQFINTVSPKTGAPTPIDRVAKYNELRATAGIEDLEKSLESNVAEQDLLLQNLEKFKLNEVDGQTSGFAQGRITEEQQSVQDRLTALQRTERILRDRAKMKTDNISEIMKLTGESYDDARSAYDSEFNRNIALYNAFSAERTREENAERSEKEKQETYDKAAYQTAYNMFTNSGKTFDELPPGFLENMAKMELRLGIPTGTFETLAKTKPKANIIQSGKSYDENGNEQAWMVVQGEDGRPEVVTTNTGGYKAPAAAAGDKEAEKARKRAIQMDQARAFIDANPQGSVEELRIGIRQKAPDLDEAEVNDLLTTKGIDKSETKFTDEQIGTYADSIVKSLKAEAKAKDTVFKKESAVLKEIYDAFATRNLSGQTSYTIKGKDGKVIATLSPRQVKKLAPLIQSKLGY